MQTCANQLCPGSMNLGNCSVPPMFIKAKEARSAHPKVNVFLLLPLLLLFSQQVVLSLYLSGCYSNSRAAEEAGSHARV